jgi:hypothetical protein
VLDANGNPIQLYRWYWVRSKKDRKTEAVYLTSSNPPYDWVSGVSRFYEQFSGRTGLSSKEYDFLPAVQPEWPEEGGEEHRQ